MTYERKLQLCTAGLICSLISFGAAAAVTHIYLMIATGLSSIFILFAEFLIRAKQNGSDVAHIEAGIETLKSVWLVIIIVTVLMNYAVEPELRILTIIGGGTAIIVCLIAVLILRVKQR